MEGNASKYEKTLANAAKCRKNCEKIREKWRKVRKCGEMGNFHEIHTYQQNYKVTENKNSQNRVDKCFNQTVHSVRSNVHSVRSIVHSARSIANTYNFNERLSKLKKPIKTTRTRKLGFAPFVWFGGEVIIISLDIARYIATSKKKKRSKRRTKSKDVEKDATEYE